MFRNYFITAFRIIIRNKIQSVIQVLSLAIGITAFILIGLYAKHELNYDRFNEKFDRIYRLEYGNRVGLPTAPGHQIKQQIPEVENVVRLINWGSKSMNVRYTPVNDSANERIIEIEDHFWCDSTIFEVFTFTFIQGDPKTALRDPKTCVLSESAARTIFGDRDPVGEILSGYTVTGIIKDVKNSHIEINMLMSVVSFDSIYGSPRGDPGYLNNYSPDFRWITYLLLPESNDPNYIEERVNDFFTENRPSNTAFFSEGKRFSLRPLKDIYFTTNLIGEFNYCRHGNQNLLRVLLTIAVFILLLAVINYVNLTTARASLRAKEVRVRKVVGSSKTRLISQFLVEAILVTVFSLLIALTMVQVLLPGFNQLASTELSMEPMVKPGAWFIYVFSVLILGVISGIYPALYLTRFQPVASLTGEHGKSAKPFIFRRILLTF
ncbi:ABC transporter permease, partial [Bacteroidota bacterium]